MQKVTEKRGWSDSAMEGKLSQEVRKSTFPFVFEFFFPFMV